MTTFDLNIKCQIKEELLRPEEEDEHLVDTSSLLTCPSPPHTRQDQDDSLPLTSGQAQEEEMDVNCGEPSKSQPLRRGSRRRKGGEVPEESSREVKQFKSCSRPKDPSSSSRSTKKGDTPKTTKNSAQRSITKRPNLTKQTERRQKNQSEESSTKKKEPERKRIRAKPSEESKQRKRDRRRERLANETPAEKEERIRKRREERLQKFEQKTEAEKEELLKRTRFLQRQRRAAKRQRRPNETEEEKDARLREMASSKFFAWEAKKASLPPEEAEQAEIQQKMKRYLGYLAYKAKFRPEEWKEKEKMRQKFSTFSVEKKMRVTKRNKAYMKRLPEETRKKYRKIAWTNYINKLKQTNPAKWEQIYERNRKRVAEETAEERHRRLLGYKVYQAKRKAKIQLEKEGVLTAEEIERRLEEVVKQVEEKDRLEREKNPVDPADYQPREKARKPKKKSQQELPKMPFPLTSSTLQELPKPPQQKQTLLSVFKQVEQCQKIDAEAEPQAVIVTRHSESPPEEESPFVDNEEKDQVETEKKKKLEYQPRFLKARKPRRKNTARKSEEELTQIETCPSPSRPQQDPHPPQLECPAAPPCSRPSEESPQVRVEEEEESFHMDDEPDADDIEPNNEEEFASLASPSPASPPSPFSPSNSEDQLEEPQQQPTGIALEVETSSEVAVGLSEEISPHRGLDSKKIRKVEERIVCDECGKCLHPQSMKVHKHLFHNPLKVSSFKCPKCDKEFTSSHRLWDHYLNLHDEEKKPLAKKVSTYDGPFICEQCGKNYSQKANLEMHMKQVHLGERIICEVCGKEEQSQGKLWRHKITKHPQLKTPPPKGTIFCQYCSEPVLRSLPQHVKKFHPDKYEEFLQNDSAAALTVSKSNRDSKIKCVECDKEIRLDSVKRHMRNVHGHGSMAFPCQHCGKEFKENYHLNEHLRIVHSVDSFGNDSGAQIVRKENKGRKRKEFCIPCQHCGKEFKERYKLSEHIRLVHTIDSFDRKVDSMKLIKESKDEDGHTLLLCSLCDEKLFRRKEIGGHLLSTHLDVFEKLTKGGDDGISPSWKCVECVEDKEPCFGSEQLFYSHVKSCHPDKTKYCSQLNCYKLFSTQHSLRVHHSKEHSHAKFINPLCFEGGTLRRPRLRCDCCMTIFLRKPELMEHVKTLHPEAYWPCPHCELMFYTEQKLTETHLRSCRRNPEVRRPKKVVKGKRGRPKKIPKKTDETDEDEDGTASESEYLGIKDEKVAITGPSLATRTRNSSRIKAKRRKNRKVNSLKKHNMNDEKLKKEVKVLILRMTKEQIDYYSKARN
ncbi:unnamed protein product [Orchesella dallaii]|uniref:C2H2-type domain-containing protein n=1 Tax=Orchesella dallaii TaxID=48710 RepID=A0ABP1PKE9_9HEXA